MRIPWRLRKGLKTVFIVLVVATIGMFWYDEIIYYFSEHGYVPGVCAEGANVAVIRIYGGIVGHVDYWEDVWVQTPADRVMEHLYDINHNDAIEAVVVEIDSGGGEPVAGEVIGNALKRTEKPTIALIRGIGASAAYMIAAGTDRVFASRFSEIGSIGVTMSYLDYTEQNKKEGIIYQQLSSGRYKDAGHPDKVLTEEERELFMRDIIKMHRIFIEMVAENRGLANETVEKLADGSTMLGEDALQAGLIDEIGDMEDVKKYLFSELDIEPVMCTFSPYEYVE
jgi:protease-4